MTKIRLVCLIFPPLAFFFLRFFNLFIFHWRIIALCWFLIFLQFFLMWTILKVFIEFVTILLLFSGFGFLAQGIWDVSSPTMDQTCTPCIGRWSLNHWTTREVPTLGFRQASSLVLSPLACLEIFFSAHLLQWSLTVFGKPLRQRRPCPLSNSEPQIASSGEEWALNRAGGTVELTW